MEMKATLVVIINKHGKPNQAVLEPTVFYKWFLTGGDFALPPASPPPRDIWHYLQTFESVKTWRQGAVSSGKQPGILLNIVRCTGQYFAKRIIWQKTSAVSSLRNCYKHVLLLPSITDMWVNKQSIASGSKNEEVSKNDGPRHTTRL